MRRWRLVLVVAALAVATGEAARADRQLIAPGTGTQDAVVIDTGADGICDTTAAKGDLQATAVGAGTPFVSAVRCGPNQMVDTAAGGDDTQVIAVGDACQNANSTVVDSGPNGIVETVLAGDDTYVNGIAFGAAPPNTACVLTGADGVAETSPPVGDDNVRLFVGQAEANSVVIRCGPNLVADTTANNAGAGDDVQLIPVGDPCGSTNDIVVDSGMDGIATSRAEGVDLVLDTVKPVRLTIKKGKPDATKVVKLSVRNVEFGAAAPATRAFRIDASRGNCGRETIVSVDADGKAAGVQATGSVGRKGRAKASVTVRARLQDVTTADPKNAERCTFNVDVVAIDTDPDVDDGANTRGNRAVVQLDVVDKNDL